MYVTRPLSLYRESPEALSAPTPEGPNSGYLVIDDEELPPACCFGAFQGPIRSLPFPQNKLLLLDNRSKDARFHNALYFIPVLDQPLSSNRYYAINANGSHKGHACVSSKAEDVSARCFMCKVAKDVKPRALDPQDAYQQFEFSAHQGCSSGSSFSAKSVASDGCPPRFLRRHGWQLKSKDPPESFTLAEANGIIDPAARQRLPYFDFPSSHGTSQPVVVGKWYVPFMFVKEKTPKDQVKRSVFYEMTLEQRWERIFACENTNRQGGSSAVTMDVVVPTEVVKLGGKDALRDERDGGEGRLVWFRNIYNSAESVGVSSLVVDRMMWEEKRAGWEDMEGKHVRGVKTEEYGGIGWWAKFSCYVLVESFVLKRIDGSPVLTYDFMHTHQLMSKWE